jgi:hypothetical protein
MGSACAGRSWDRSRRFELNAPGGIPDYCHRYGASLASLSSADAGLYRSPDLELVLKKWGKQPTTEEIANHTRWRDRRLAALKAHKRMQAAREAAVEMS